MNKLKNKAIIFFLAIILVIPNAALAQSNTETIEYNVDFFTELLEHIKEVYPFKVTEEQLIQQAMKGMLTSLDDYSNFYTKEEADVVYGSLTGSFTGIGIYIEEKEGYINIVDTIKEQPAEKSGLKKDDLITKINDVDVKTIEFNKASSMIKGEKGTTVKLTIKRGTEILNFNIIRENITISPVTLEIMDNIAYISLETFNTKATSELKKALKTVDEHKIDRVILDLRNNGGGLLAEALSISKLFVPKGEILHVRYGNKPMETHYSSLYYNKYKLIVLVNENTASAAEIVAGAIKDRKAGTIIGTRTFGKGIIQTLQPLIDGSIVKLTTAEYLTPNKTSIHKIGIEPNIIIENTEEDLQLKKAIEILK